MSEGVDGSESSSPERSAAPGRPQTASGLRSRRRASQAPRAVPDELERSIPSGWKKLPLDFAQHQGGLPHPVPRRELGELGNGNHAARTSLERRLHEIEHIVHRGGARKVVHEIQLARVAGGSTRRSRTRSKSLSREGTLSRPSRCAATRPPWPPPPEGSIRRRPRRRGPRGPPPFRACSSRPIPWNRAGESPRGGLGHGPTGVDREGDGGAEARGAHALAEGGRGRSPSRPSARAAGSSGRAMRPLRAAESEIAAFSRRMSLMNEDFEET